MNFTNRNLSYIISISALTLLACSLSADPSVEAWKSLAAAYARCDAAAGSRDAAGTLAIDTQGYQVVTTKGKVLFTNGPKMLQQYRKTYAGAAQVKQKTSVEKLTLKDNVATATVLQRLQLSAIDPNINNWRTWVIDWRMEDTWIEAGGAWKRKKTVMLNQSSSKRIGPIEQQPASQ